MNMKPPRGPAHLSPAHRRFVYGVFAVLVASATLWLAFHYFVVSEGPFGPERHPLEAWSLRLHGAAAMATLLIVGSLLPDHVRLGWLRRRNLTSAIPLAALVAFLVITGYCLYYAADEELRGGFSLAHWLAGFASGVAFLVHAFRRSSRRPARSHKTTESHV